MNIKDLIDATRERRCLIERLEIAHREYLPLSDRVFPGHEHRLDRLIRAMADVADFNRHFPKLAIPKLVGGKVPVPVLGAPLSDTSRPVPT